MLNINTISNRFTKINYHTVLDETTGILVDGQTIYTGYVINHRFTSPAQSICSGVTEEKRYYTRTISGRTKRVILSEKNETLYAKLLNRKLNIISF